MKALVQQFKILVLLFICSFLATSIFAASNTFPTVARLSYMKGVVSFSPAGINKWIKVSLNRPLVIGDRLWSDIDGLVELQLGAAVIRLGNQTSLKISNLNNTIAQFQQTNGKLALSIRSENRDRRYEIDTPNLAFTTTKSGYYRIDVDSKKGITVVTVLKGRGDIYGKNASFKIKEGETCRFTGNDLKGHQCSAVGPIDDFDRFNQERDRRSVKSVVKYVSPEMIGYEDLEHYGTWKVNKTYGRVWVPHVTVSNWAPYRMGHWVWLNRWGWTWIDDQPWGFAPFHYGRWLRWQNQWTWVPGPRHIEPVYAPALVVFVGGRQFNLQVNGSRGIAWFPLAPGEVYIPPYQVNRNYFVQINISNTVINQTYINQVFNAPKINIVYQNINVPNGITAVPTAAFVQSAPVNTAVVQISPKALSNAPKSPVATVVPGPASVQGGHDSTNVAPSKEIVSEQAITKNEPPPAPVPFTQEQPLLENNPGKPLTNEQSEQLSQPSQEQQNPEAKQTPDVQQNPEVQQAPDVQQNPEVQQAPDVQQNPEVQQAPDVQQNPEVQQAPDVQQNPEVQQAPDVQQNPEVQQAPDVQQN
ncbi:DUF6600 domain-containing protein, partial [Legionella hackeliae]